MRSLEDAIKTRLYTLWRRSIGSKPQGGVVSLTVHSIMLWQDSGVTECVYHNHLIRWQVVDGQSTLHEQNQRPAGLIIWKERPCK